MANVIKRHYAERHYAERHYAELHYAECHYAERHYAERHYAECRGAIIYNVKLVCFTSTNIPSLRINPSGFLTNIGLG